MFTSCPPISACLLIQSLYQLAWVHLLFSSEMTHWDYWEGSASTKILQLILCHGNFLPVVTVLIKRNLYNVTQSLITQKLWPLIYLYKLPSSTYKGRCLLPTSSQRCIKRNGLKACTSVCLIILITSCKTLLHSDDFFFSNQLFSRGDTDCRLTSEATSLT